MRSRRQSREERVPRLAYKYKQSASFPLSRCDTRFTWRPVDFCVCVYVYVFVCVRVIARYTRLDSSRDGDWQVQAEERVRAQFRTTRRRRRRRKEEKREEKRGKSERESRQDRFLPSASSSKIARRRSRVSRVGSLGSPRRIRQKRTSPWIYSRLPLLLSLSTTLVAFTSVLRRGEKKDELCLDTVEPISQVSILLPWFPTVLFRRNTAAVGKSSPFTWKPSVPSRERTEATLSAWKSPTRTTPDLILSASPVRCSRTVIESETGRNTRSLDRERLGDETKVGLVDIVGKATRRGEENKEEKNRQREREREVEAPLQSRPLLRVRDSSSWVNDLSVRSRVRATPRVVASRTRAYLSARVRTHRWFGGSLACVSRGVKRRSLGTRRSAAGCFHRARNNADRALTVRACAVRASFDNFAL